MHFVSRLSGKMYDINLTLTLNLSIDIVDEWLTENADFQFELPKNGTGAEDLDTACASHDLVAWNTHDHLDQGMCTCVCRT